MPLAANYNSPIKVMRCHEESNHEASHKFFLCEIICTQCFRFYALAVFGLPFCAVRRIGAAVGKSCELYKLNELNTARKLEQSWRGLYQHAQMRNWLNMLLWNQKVVRACSVLYILTLKCASRYSGVQFFHIATSKSGPYPSVF